MLDRRAGPKDPNPPKRKNLLWLFFLFVWTFRNKSNLFCATTRDSQQILFAHTRGLPHMVEDAGASLVPPP